MHAHIRPRHNICLPNSCSFAAQGQAHQGKTAKVTEAAHLRAVEHTELVHVIPDIQVLGGALVLVEHELGGPPVPGGRV